VFGRSEEEIGMKESVEPSNRRLIRPSLTEMKEQVTHKRPQVQPQPQQKQKRSTPPDQTYAENFYYLKQMQNRTPMVLVLKDGEELRGYIEWYDRSCLKVNREGEPNLLVYKDSIKYLYKESERRTQGPSGGRGKTNGAPRD
jgi:sRNA-binding regulator protein Hfq